MSRVWSCLWMAGLRRCKRLGFSWSGPGLKPAPTFIFSGFVARVKRCPSVQIRGLVKFPSVR